MKSLLISLFVVFSLISSSAYSSEFIAFCHNKETGSDLKLVRSGEQYAVLILTPKLEGFPDWQRTSVSRNYLGDDYYYNTNGYYGFTLVQPAWNSRLSRWENTYGFSGTRFRSYKVDCIIDTPNFTQEWVIKRNH
jgi:hypothetical protein